MEMMQKLFNSYGPRAEKTLDETLIMKPKDFEMNFLHSIWRELVRVVVIIRDAESPKKSNINCTRGSQRVKNQHQRPLQVI